MQAPYRIYRPGTAPKTGPRRPGHRTPRPGSAVPAAPASDGFGLYLDRLMKMMPAEVLSLYLVGNGLVPEGAPNAVLTVWFLLCLAGVIALRVWGTADPTTHKPTDWVHVAISALAFIIWVYSMGGPFDLYGLHIQYVGSLLVLAWSFFVPIFYKGPQN